MFLDRGDHLQEEMEEEEGGGRQQEQEQGAERIHGGGVLSKVRSRRKG